MPNYDLNRLGPDEFERLVQALLKPVIGPGTITFGDGPDGGREATYSGLASYPSPSDQWSGEWIFQAKFHDINQIGPDKARKAVLADLKNELEKVTSKYKRKCDNYILATNVPLSSVSDIGSHDKIAETAMEYHEKIKHIQVWGYDDLCRLLDVYSDVRRTYLHMLTPGDLIAELMDTRIQTKSQLSEIVHLYTRTCFNNEQYALLDQAGEIGEERMLLRKIYIDLDVKPRSEKDLAVFARRYPEIVNRLNLMMKGDEVCSATKLLTQLGIPKAVLIGGPGQGKSTLGQYIAQIHRAYLLKKSDELNGNYTPAIVRIPFRIVLREFAQEIAESHGKLSVEAHLAKLVSERAGRQVSSEHVQQLLKQNPILIVLDGLDEVTDRRLRAKMVDLLDDFVARSEDVLKADIQIVATSRPTGYADQFDISSFLHLTLANINSQKVHEYTDRWIESKGIETAKATTLRSSISDCLADPNFSALMNTPLQVTIFILIILSGGTPPRQREELFNEYLEVIYKRERAKSKTIIQTEKRLLFGLHEYMGYLLHRRAELSNVRSEMKETEFRAEVVRYLKHNDPFSKKDELDHKAEKIIEEARERLVLLVQPEEGYFGFELRSIQEFFAAAYLVSTSDNRTRNQLFARFQAIALPSHWRNVALFFAGRVGRLHLGDAALILEACRDIDRSKPDRFTKRGAWLALEIAGDRSFGPNRVLQRSAIEFALTLLDGHFSERRHELLSNLKQLPQEDREQILIPLLRERLDRINVSDDFLTAEALASLTQKPSSVEQAFTNALDRKSVGSVTLLQHAISLGLSPEFIRRSLWTACSRIPSGALADLFVFPFITQPRYVVKVWHAIGLPSTTAIDTFNAALYFSYEIPPRWPFGLAVEKDKFSQIELAWNLFALTEFVEFQRSSRSRLLYRTRFHGRRLEFLEFLSSERPFGDLGPAEALDRLMQIAADPENTIELRIMALASLSRTIYATVKMPVDDICRKFLSKSDKRQIEYAEQLLYHAGAPSLSALARISEVDYGFVRDRLLSLQRARNGRMMSAIRRLSTIDPLDQWRAEEVWREDRSIIELYRRLKIQPEIIRIVTRRSDFAFHHMRHELDIRFVTKTLNVANSILQEETNQKWRAWAVVSRLGSCKWKDQPSHRTQLAKGLVEFCRTIQLQDMSSHCHLEIVGLAARAADVALPKPIIRRLLRCIGNMHDGRPSDHDSYRSGLSWGLDSKAVVQLVTAAQGGGLIERFGFLRFLALHGVHAPSERIRLNWSSTYIISLLKREQGLIRQGALLALALKSRLSITEARRIIEFSRYDIGPMRFGWSKLINKAVHDSDRIDAIEFLESILSATKYPKYLKQAALETYQDFFRMSAPSMRQLERKLGLPFQETSVQTT